MVSSRGSSDGWLRGKMVYFLMLAGLIIEKLCAALRGFDARDHEAVGISDKYYPP